MNPPTSISTARREFLRFLAASPYVATLGGVGAFFERELFAQKTTSISEVISSPAEALNVLDFEDPLIAKSCPAIGPTW